MIFFLAILVVDQLDQSINNLISTAPPARTRLKSRQTQPRPIKNRRPRQVAEFHKLTIGNAKISAVIQQDRLSIGGAVKLNKGNVVSHLEEGAWVEKDVNHIERLI
jgi:hypothetical protein